MGLCGPIIEEIVSGCRLPRLGNVAAARQIGALQPKFNWPKKGALGASAKARAYIMLKSRESVRGARKNDSGG